jgi:hypothetical protein
MNTIKPLPPIKETGTLGYLLWLRRDIPEVYKKIVSAFPEVANFERVYQRAGNPALSGWADIFSGLSSAASSVGSVLGNVGSAVAQALPSVASIYSTVQGGKLANAQLQYAQRNQTPVQTGYVTTPYGQVYPAPIAQTASPYPGQPYGVPQSAYPSYQPSMLSARVGGIPVWVIAAGIGGVGLLLLLRR